MINGILLTGRSESYINSLPTVAIVMIIIIIIIAIYIKWLFIKSAVKAGTKEALTELYRLYRYDMEQAEKKQQVEDNDNHLS